MEELLYWDGTKTWSDKKTQPWSIEATKGTILNLKIFLSSVSWNCRVIVIACLFPTTNIILFLETWEKYAIGIVKFHGYSHFSFAWYGSRNIQFGTTTWGHGGMLVIVMKCVCRWVTHLPTTHTYTHMCIRILEDIGSRTIGILLTL